MIMITVTKLCTESVRFLERKKVSNSNNGHAYKVSLLSWQYFLFCVNVYRKSWNVDRVSPFLCCFICD